MFQFVNIIITESEELKCTDNASSSPVQSDQAKTYADITRRVDAMALTDEVENSQTEQSSRNVQMSSLFFF